MAAAIEIKEYSPEFQPGIDGMMERIQQGFDERISSPQSTKIYEAYLLPDQKYWVALHDELVVGTVGVVLLSNGSCVLKRMMVDPDYRGGETKLALRLLQKGVDWAKEKGSNKMYLGTMEQFKAAQKFYEKSGFAAIDVAAMPADATLNPIDTRYYAKEI